MEVDDVTIVAAVMTDEVVADMMTEEAEIMVDEATIVVVTDETVMVAEEIIEIEADRQDEIIAAMIVMIVEVKAVLVPHVAETDMKIDEGTTADEEMMVADIMMIDVALTRMIINKNVMKIVAIVVDMTIVGTVATIIKVATTIIAVVAMMVQDHTHDRITNTMIVEDTNKSEMIEDKKDQKYVHSRSVNLPDWFRLPLENNYRIDVRKS